MDICHRVKPELRDPPRTGFSLLASPSEIETPATCEDGSPISSRLSSLSSPVDPASQPTLRLPILSKKLKPDNSRPPRLIDHLPQADQHAYNTFEVLVDNVLSHRNLGSSHQSLDTMICDCQYDPCSDDPYVACGPSSQCINRLTQVECLPYECPTRNACQNQRFARKQYADIEIVQTEQKGFGLRAAANIGSDEFVYEYIGEVIPEQTFRIRIKEYAEEGIQHFYFMMLQKGEYIDATKRGGIARFLNHSCEPNCYVAKWVVGKRMRMGIFAKREIVKGEELTFNYNVDRYGYDAQACYCGEPNCLGTIGGKVQTDIRTMDPLYIEALGGGIHLLSTKGSRKRKMQKIEDIDLDTLTPLQGPEVQKVFTAIRQAANEGHKDIITRLLHRLNMTVDPEAYRAMMRYKGFSAIGCVFDMLILDESEDETVVHLALKVLDKWRIRSGNKIQDSGIQSRIESLLPRLTEQNQTLARHIMTRWQALPITYELPKREVSAGDQTYRPIADDDLTLEPRWKEEIRPIEFELAPVVHANYASRPVVREAEFRNKLKVPMPSAGNQTAELELILAAAKEDADTEELGTADSLNVRQSNSNHVRGSNVGQRERKHKRSKTSSTESKDDRLGRLVRELVIRNMSRYKRHIDRDTFKKQAEQCTIHLVEKEKRSQSYPDSAYHSLTEEKITKMNHFIRDYSERLLRKLAERGKLLGGVNRAQAQRGQRHCNSNSDHTSSFSPMESISASANDNTVPSGNHSKSSSLVEGNHVTGIDLSDIAELRPLKRIPSEVIRSSLRHQVAGSP